MDFDEIKCLFESSLRTELGAEQPFHVVKDSEWTGPCPSGNHDQHLGDIPRACYDCHCIHVPESDYDDFTEARIAASIEMLVERLEDLDAQHQ